jgi:hypothetical protein
MFDLAGNVLILTGPDDTLAAVEAGLVTVVFGSVQLAEPPRTMAVCHDEKVEATLLETVDPRSPNGR